MLIIRDIVLVEIKGKCNVSKIYYYKIVGLEYNIINIGEFVYVRLLIGKLINLWVYGRVIEKRYLRFYII